MVDMVVKRHDIPETLARVLKIMTGAPPTATAMLEAPRQNEAIADETPHEPLDSGEAPTPQG